MKFKALIIILVLVISQVVLDSCCKINTSYNIDGMYLVNLDNSGGTPKELSSYNDSIVNKNAYGIRIYLTTNVRTAQNMFNNFNFIGKTYALACKQDYTLSNKIQSINIITFNDFDDTHSVGAEITEYFNGLSNEYGPYIPIEDKINELNSSLSEMPEYFDIYLMNPPTQGEIFRFGVKITLYDGYIADLTTDYITLF